ncbi:hypothetical protein [Noviherbaspirillum pedocola]|uniref:Uncharacterized protein n=1 Tax=Noviherbaspirillum pedocola TaxID=2801341 RepID=A0A934SV82_9BURK|nr:hypothetical protein [Noviherbaspirillum pedocola]MBK4736040.1 hypothetical protein [Noviherbaspirillum pedocola]
MSHHIEYRYLAVRIPGKDLADNMDRFFVCIECGDSNEYEGPGHGARRARRWSVKMLGTLEDILEQACYYAVACETESMRPLARDCTAEAYIRRIRSLVDSARVTDGSVYATPIALSYECAVGSDDDILLQGKGVSREVDGNVRYAFLSTDGTTDYRTFFEVYPLLGRRHQHAWCFAKCRGQR